MPRQRSKAPPRRSPPEKVVGTGPVADRAVLLQLTSRDLALQHRDPRIEFGDRQRIEVLPHECVKQIVGTGGGVFQVHRASNVDPHPSDVNKAFKSNGRDEQMITIPGTLPDIMKAIDPEQPGGPEVLVLVDRPVPKLGAGEVLVKVAAAGVNRPEVMQRQGKYPPPPGAPSILGMEISGTIVAVGDDVGTEQIGQLVCALISGGAYAEYAVAPFGQCLPVPEALTMVEAAAMPETLFTVWTNLFERAYATEGDTVLVHGGTSGIGTMAIALCNVFGIDIIVTAGSKAKCEAALSLGATHAIDYKTEDFVERVKQITGGKGVAAVLDMVGGDYVPRNLQCLAEDGRHVSIAVQGGMTATVPLFEIMRRRLTLTGSTLRPRDTAFKSLVADELARTVWPHVEAGKLKPVIDRAFAFADAPAAHARMEAGDHVGKIVLTME
jgi:NADPH2:quinone reductase